MLETATIQGWFIFCIIATLATSHLNSVAKCFIIFVLAVSITVLQLNGNSNGY